MRDDKTLCMNKQKLVAMATSLERLQPNFTAIIYVCKATNPENWAKIDRVLSEIIGLEQIGSSFGS